LKPLLFLPSPRDIPEVKESVDKLKIDKLWVKYYPQEEAYQTARNFFLYNYEYTHLVIHPDDLIATQDNLEWILLTTGDDRVMSGWCINTIKDNWQELNDTNISYNLPHDPPAEGVYEDFNFIPVKDIETLLSQGTAIIKVKFAGFALCCIPRTIVEQIPFRGDDDCCMDSTFSLDLEAQLMEQFVNMRVRTQHLKIPFNELQTGKKEKQIIYEQDKD
jgi:hypothetical protein